MIKLEKQKLWQKIAIWTDKFWRHFGNRYSQKLLWYCDNCKKKIDDEKYQVDNPIEKHYCKGCYEKLYVNQNPRNNK